MAGWRPIFRALMSTPPPNPGLSQPNNEDKFSATSICLPFSPLPSSSKSILWPFAFRSCLPSSKISGKVVCTERCGNPAKVDQKIRCELRRSQSQWRWKPGFKFVFLWMWVGNPSLSRTLVILRLSTFSLHPGPTRARLLLTTTALERSSSTATLKRTKYLAREAPGWMPFHLAMTGSSNECWACYMYIDETTKKHWLNSCFLKSTLNQFPNRFPNKISGSVFFLSQQGNVECRLPACTVRLVAGGCECRRPFGAKCQPSCINERWW